MSARQCRDTSKWFCSGCQKEHAHDTGSAKTADGREFCWRQWHKLSTAEIRGQAAPSNTKPLLKWFKVTINDGLDRWHLWTYPQAGTPGERTPYFVDVAKVIAHRANGYRISLHGAGMGEMTRAGYRIAAFLAGFDTVSAAKTDAERRELERSEPVQTALKLNAPNDARQNADAAFAVRAAASERHRQKRLVEHALASVKQATPVPARLDGADTPEQIGKLF